jgi:hypothetical protein
MFAALPAVRVLLGCPACGSHLSWLPHTLRSPGTMLDSMTGWFVQCRVSFHKKREENPFFCKIKDGFFPLTNQALNLVLLRCFFPLQTVLAACGSYLFWLYHTTQSMYRYVYIVSVQCQQIFVPQVVFIFIYSTCTIPYSTGTQYPDGLSSK